VAIWCLISPGCAQSGTWAFSITAQNWKDKLLNMEEGNKISSAAVSANVANS
jgi:hypothetical protein